MVSFLAVTGHGVEERELMTKTRVLKFTLLLTLLAAFATTTKVKEEGTYTDGLTATKQETNVPLALCNLINITPSDS